MEAVIKYRSSLFVLMLVCISWLGFVDRYAEEYIDDSLVTTAVSFTSAKLFNATVSVLSTITLNVPFIGSIQIGELLDPLNDMVEDFSTIMKYSISSLLIQKIIVSILQTMQFKIFITLSGLVFFLTKYYFKGSHVIAYKVFVFALACKFSIALVAIASGWVDSAFIKESIDEQNKELSEFPVAPSNLNNALDLSSEIKVQMKSEMRSLSTKSDLIKVSLSASLEEKEKLKLDKVKLDSAIESETKDRSMLDNIMNKTQKIKALESERDEVSDKIDELNNSIDDLNSELAEVQEDIESLEHKINGGDVSTYQSIKDGFNNITMAAKNKVTGFVDTLNLAMDNFINLMALFIFRTMVLPIVFLFSMYKFFKFVWGVDIKSEVKGIVSIKDTQKN